MVPLLWIYNIQMQIALPISMEHLSRLEQEGGSGSSEVSIT